MESNTSLALSGIPRNWHGCVDCVVINAMTAFRSFSSNRLETTLRSCTLWLVMRRRWLSGSLLADTVRDDISNKRASVMYKWYSWYQSLPCTEKVGRVHHMFVIMHLCPPN